MKAYTIGKLFSTALLGLVLGSAVHHDQMEREQMGREAFLAKQATRFDKYHAKPHSIALDLVGTVFIGAAVVGVYELLAFGVSKALKKVYSGEEIS